MTKGNWIFLTVLVVLLTGHFLLYIAGFPQYPSPKDLESMEVYQMLNDSIHPDSTPEEAIHAFSQMCQISVDCLSDKILVEYNQYTDSDFNIHLVRQFQFSDNYEYVQLHLDLTFPVSQMKDIPRSCTWYNTESVDILKILENCSGFQAVSDLVPSDVRVSIGWTW